MIADIESSFALPPLESFALLMGVLLIVPALCDRMRVPEVVGFIVTGIVLGADLIGVIPRHGIMLDFGSDLGKLLLMFFVGLEIDLGRLRDNRAQAVAFGVLACLAPLAAGAAVALLFGYGLLTAIVVGVLLAPHTLLAAPLFKRAGLMGRAPIVAVTGGTIVTDLLALFVFSMCLTVAESGGGAGPLLVQAGLTLGYIVLVIFGSHLLGRFFFHYFPKREAAEAVFVLGVVALAAHLADLAGIEGIVGAFLVGLSVNALLHGTRIEARLDFLGNFIFIPLFFLSIGLIVDVPGLLTVLTENGLLLAALLAAMIAGKYAAARAARGLFGYRADETRAAWTMTLPHVAATLAVALTAYETVDGNGARLLPESLFGVALALVFVSALAGPLLSGREAARMAKKRGAADGKRSQARNGGTNEAARESPRS